jgi:hypothetical protein
MSLMVRVYNDNTVEHVETFKGQIYRIPPGGFITMETDEAVQFKSQFRTPVFDKGKNQTPESKKRLRLEEIQNGAKTAPQQDEYLCHKCGFKAQNKAGLSAHTRANHLESMVDEDAKKELQKGA